VRGRAAGLSALEQAAGYREGWIVSAGQVSSLLAKRAAQEDALGTVGVARAVDRISIPRGPAPGDQVRARRIREALERDPIGDLSRLGVQVDRVTADEPSPGGGRRRQSRAAHLK